MRIYYERKFKQTPVEESKDLWTDRPISKSLNFPANSNTSLFSNFRIPTQTIIEEIIQRTAQEFP